MTVAAAENGVRKTIYRPIWGLVGCGLTGLGITFACSVPIVGIINAGNPELASLTLSITAITTALIGIASGVVGWISNQRAQNEFYSKENTS